MYSMIPDVQQIVVIKDRSKEDDFGNAYKMLSKWWKTVSVTTTYQSE